MLHFRFTVLLVCVLLLLLLLIFFFFQGILSSLVLFGFTETCKVIFEHTSELSAHTLAFMGRDVPGSCTAVIK